MAGKNSVIAGGGFHHVAVKVHDYDATIKFYKGIGCVERLSWGTGNDRGMLLDTGDGNYMEVFAGGPDIKHDPAGAGAAVIHVCFRSSNVDLAIKAAEKAGGKVTIAPKDHTIPSTPPTKIRIAFCQSPGGEVVEFFQNETL